MLVVVSQSSPDPLYRQVADQVRDAIASGDVKTGDRLPSIRELAEALNMSVITVKRAYADLDMEGYIVTRPGLGCFVAEVDRERLRSEKLAELKRELTRTIASARQFRITCADIARLVNEIEEG